MSSSANKEDTPLHRSDDYLDPELKQITIDAFKQAYRLNGGRFYEDWGDNANTFGTCVTHNARHFLSQGLEKRAAGGAVKISRPSNSYQVRTDLCTMHYYKSGENVHALKFDQSAIKARLTEENQYLLPFTQEQLAANERITQGEPPFVHLVFAHTGTPLEGLRELYVGVPNGKGKDGTSPWAWVDLIYVAGDDEGGFGVEGLIDGPSPFTDRPTPDVQIRPRESENTQ